MRKLNPAAFLLFFLIATMPILSGAVHPLLQSIYTFLILLTSGIWLALNFDSIEFKAFSLKPYLIFIILGCIILSAVNLPLDIIQFLSPVRAASLATAINTGQLTGITTSLSYYVPGSRYYAVFGLALLLYYFFASAFLKWKENRKIILWIITFIGTMEALYGLLQLLVPSTAGILPLPFVKSEGNFPSGTFTNHNHYAAFLNICWPISLVLGISMTGAAIEKSAMFKITKKKLSPVDWLKLLFCRANLPYWATIFMIMSVMLSKSVAGIIIMVIIIILCRIIIPFPRRIKITLSATLYLGLLGYGLMTGVKNINDAIIAIPDGVIAKYYFWVESLDMLKEHLMTGIGMGSYQYISHLYLTNITENRLFTHAYNEYIELAIEIGLPAMFLFVLWIMTGLIFSGKKITAMPRKIQKMTQDEIIIIGSFCSLLGILMHASVGTIWHGSAIIFYTITVIAILTTITTKEKTEKHYTPDRIIPKKKASTFLPYRGRKRRVRH